MKPDSENTPRVDASDIAPADNGLIEDDSDGDFENESPSDSDDF